MPETPTSIDPATSSSLSKGGEDYISTPYSSEESDWVPPGDANDHSLQQSAPVDPTSYNSLSEHIAHVRSSPRISSYDDCLIVMPRTILFPSFLYQGHRHQPSLLDSSD